MTGELAGILDGALPPAGAPGRTADDDQAPFVPAAPPGDQVTVYLTVAVRTSQGPGPGPLTLPRDEAARLVAQRFAVYGGSPPLSFLGTPAPAVREFRLCRSTRIVLSPGVTLPWGQPGCSIWMRPGTVLDCLPGSKLETAIIAAGGALSPVIGPRDPRRAPEICDDFDKSALAN